MVPAFHSGFHFPSAAIRFFREQSQCPPFSLEEFNEQCGVGVHLSDKEIQLLVKSTLNDSMESILTSRYRHAPSLLKLLRGHVKLRWANGKVVKDSLDDQLSILLGPKDDRDSVQKKVVEYAGVK